MTHRLPSLAVTLLVVLAVVPVGGCDGGPAGSGGTMVYSPSTDTTLIGTQSFDRVVIPEGVTVTVTGDLDLTVADSLHVAGALVGDCHAIRLAAGGHVVVLGRVANSCSTAPAGASPPLSIAAEGGLTLDGARIGSSGPITITDQARGLSPAGAQRRAVLAESETVIVRSAHILAEPVRGPGGSQGMVGGSGVNGPPIRLLFARAVRFDGTTLVRSQAGGAGGLGLHETTDSPALASGGRGGRGGDVELVSAATIFALTPRALTLLSGEGGRGGEARARVVGVGDALPAEAHGGGGGSPGRILVEAQAFLVGTGSLEAEAGAAAAGGDAEAIGGAGAPATAQTAARSGGKALARGGPGGSVPGTTIIVRGSDAANVRIASLPAGGGGDVIAVGGAGGAGSPEHPQGGSGGDVEVHGGPGGDVLQLDEAGGHTFVAAAGGTVVLSGGRGGSGGSGCATSAAGGNGGSGGSAIGEDGPGGTIGRKPGLPGGAILSGVANGGIGGEGVPAGAGGAPGGNAFRSVGIVRVEPPVFQAGGPGRSCGT